MKSRASCIRRHMYGPPAEPAGFRYFGGWYDFIAANWPLSLTILGINTGYMMRNIVNYSTNNSIHNMIIPVVYGTYRLASVECAYGLDYNNYWNMVYLVAEGECSGVAINTTRVNGVVVSSPNSTDPLQVWWGGTGQRKVYNMQHSTIYDSYANKPMYIGSSSGDGPSFSDIFAIWCLSKQNNDTGDKSGDTNYPTLDITFIGRKIRTIQGWIDYQSDGVDDPDQWTSAPDPIEVAVDYCVNGKFGPRLDLSRIDLSSALLASTYCKALVYRTDDGHETETVMRYTFNGCLDKDQNTEAQLASILDNCNGYYIPNGRLLTFGIRKAESLAAVDAMVKLTDTGTNRNILRPEGKSSLVVENTDSIGDYINNVEVEFSDITVGYVSNTLHLYDEMQQTLASRVLNTDFTRAVNTEQISLPGTVTLDQAQRLGVLRLREEYLKRTKYTFQMSLKDSIALAPGDVRKLNSFGAGDGSNIRKIADNEYVRIWKIEETDKFTATIEASPHNNDYYDNEVGVVIPYL